MKPPEIAAIFQFASTIHPSARWTANWACAGKMDDGVVGVLGGQQLVSVMNCKHCLVLQTIRKQFSKSIIEHLLSSILANR